MDEQDWPPRDDLDEECDDSHYWQGQNKSRRSDCEVQASLGATAKGLEMWTMWSCKRQGLILSIRVNLPGGTAFNRKGRPFVARSFY